MNFVLRTATEDDYNKIISVVNDWWDGRSMADMLPRLFFVHFRNTSLVVELDNAPVAFLCGFISQANPKQAYIHFVGVNPKYRHQGLARNLYNNFFAQVRVHGCREVHCVTAPINKGSIAFHKKMGFITKEGRQIAEEGVPFTADYDGPGQNRVLFLKIV